MKNSVGIVQTKYFNFENLSLDCGQSLKSVTLAYEAYGELNSARSNAILILHALSGDAHAAGFHKDADKPGWWNDMIGPGKAFDTDRYFVICSNIIGGCKGSTGPSSVNPQTGRPYALNFPLITISDMVRAQKILIEALGIEKLLCISGGSMGGMQTLEWLVKYPDFVRSAIPIATAAKHSSQQIAFDEVARQAIMADPNWCEGDYYDKIFPAKGLAVARMLGHITYMSDISMEEKFGRKFKEKYQKFKFDADFEVEGYLKYRGDKFVERFDANSFLYITKAMDYFDIAGDKKLYQVFKNVKSNVLVISFKSDWLYPSYQSQALVKAFKAAGVDASYCEINSTYGHDAFLVETENQSRLIKHFLKKAEK